VHAGSASGRSCGLRPGMRIADLLTLRDHTDENGRLLLEDSAPKQAMKRARRDGVPMKSTRCPYEDSPSRLGGDMNASAYDALRRDTAGVLDGFAWLGRHYFGVEPANRGTTQGLTDVSSLGLSLPLVLFRRGTDPMPAQAVLPSYIASLFKASRGVFSASVDLLNQAGHAPTTGAEVAAFAEREGHFVRQHTGRVCAAPTRLIERSIDVVLTATGADASRSGLADLLPFGLLWEFWNVEQSFNRGFDRYGQVLRNLLEASGGVTDPEALFATTVVDRGVQHSFGAFTEAFLEFANAAQAELNRLLGRAQNASPLRFEDLVRIL
jgi:hypothetical protein